MPCVLNYLFLKSFVGGTYLSPIRYCSLWEWAEELMPPSRIYSIPHRGETPRDGVSSYFRVIQACIEELCKVTTIKKGCCRVNHEWGDSCKGEFFYNIKSNWGLELGLVYLSRFYYR